MHSFDLHHGDFRRIDLNLLVAFDALMQERHVSRAAARLFVGQPAMSHALARLRDVLGDPLFVRTGNQMEPTARALALAPHIRAWLEDANQFLFAPDNFDPAQAQATFSLAAPDGMEAILYPALIGQLRTQAPGVQLRSYLLETDQQLTALDNDDVDLLITATPLPLRDWHSHQLLMQSGFTAIHAQSQLNLPDPPTLADLARCDHVASSYRGSAAGVVDHLFAANGLARRIVAMSASLIAISHIIRQAPLVSVQPTLYLPLFRSTPDIVCTPLDDTVHININMVWHCRNDKQPLHRFLRTLLCEQQQCRFGDTPAVPGEQNAARCTASG